MTVIASGLTDKADSWQLRVSTNEDTGPVITMVDIQLADGTNLWGGGCGGVVPPEQRLSTYFGAGDTGPRTFIARA